MSITSEEKILSTLDVHGLVRDVEHKIWNKPKTGKEVNAEFGLNAVEVNPFDGKTKYYKGVTIVRLYTKEVWATKVKAKKKEDKGGSVSEGVAYCSSMQPHYSRKSGRMKAMGRAFQNFLGCHKCLKEAKEDVEAEMLAHVNFHTRS